jgi:ribosomal protein RSM22 (predicted rRNA methylase)
MLRGGATAVRFIVTQTDNRNDPRRGGPCLAATRMPATYAAIVGRSDARQGAEFAPKRVLDVGCGLGAALPRHV